MKAGQLPKVQLAVANQERSIDLAADSVMKAFACESETVQPVIWSQGAQAISSTVNDCSSDMTGGVRIKILQMCRPLHHLKSNLQLFIQPE